MLIKDGEKTWAVCGKCGGAYDIRKGGSCKCKNVQSERFPNGAVMTIIEDSDDAAYDNDR